MLRYKSSRLDTKDEKYKLCAAFFKFPPKPFLLNKSQNFAHDFQSTPKNCNMLGSANLDSIIAFPIYIDNELNFQPERIIFPIQSSSSHQVPVISLSSFHTIQSKHKPFSMPMSSPNPVSGIKHKPKPMSRHAKKEKLSGDLDRIS